MPIIILHRFFTSGAPPTNPTKLPKPVSRSNNPLMHNAPVQPPAGVSIKQARPREEDEQAEGAQRPAKKVMVDPSTQ